MPDDRALTVVAVDPPGLAMSKVGDVGQGSPVFTQVTKKAGSPAGGTLSAPGVQVIVTDGVVEPTVAPDKVGATLATAQPVDCAELDVIFFE